ncbi:YtpI family protein [Aciduricibacillus chroicocephali]|uniref:YtpI family protein n=1 Tax=Aciduricibacillus chroicocephali TaxID=3054939 RepID=A0ABY9KVK9_9BACI|nr:YtpI family protein [Bacillaceae bacterium 44XB]
MFIVAVLILLSAILYIYYKVQILRTRDSLRQVYFNAKAKLCLGSLVFFFGINQYILYQTRLSLFIGIVFLLIGGALSVRGFKETKHYRGEWKRLRTE